MLDVTVGDTQGASIPAMAYQSMGELKRSERISSDGLQSFLDILNLGHYTEKFRENGMQDVESLKLIRVQLGLCEPYFPVEGLWDI
eukprot:1394205-Amorphochlora_amoeboformis.AAC.1